MWNWRLKNVKNIYKNNSIHSIKIPYTHTHVKKVKNSVQNNKNKVSDELSVVRFN